MPTCKKFDPEKITRVTSFYPDRPLSVRSVHQQANPVRTPEQLAAMGFRKLGLPYFGSPYNKDPTI